MYELQSERGGVIQLILSLELVWTADKSPPEVARYAPRRRRSS